MSGRNHRHSESAGPQAPAAGQASEWIVLLESGDANDAERARFEEWLAADPKHRAAYTGLNDTWSRLQAMRARVRAAGGVESGPAAVLQGLGQLTRRKVRRRRLAWTAVAALLVVAVLTAVRVLPGDSELLYATEVGEHRTVSLADGSTVELNTDTELQVELTNKHRRVTLVRGEAFFEVAGDVDRPFVVMAGHGAIRAVGTGFSVRLESPDRVSVMVTEGIVEVTHPDSAGSLAAPARTVAEAPVLHRGQRAEYDREATRIEEVTPDELERTQAWRRGLLVFEDASLAEVIGEVNRYTDAQLVLADPAIGELRLGGTFKAGRVDALLFVLEKSFGIQATQAGTGVIELRPAPDDATS